MDAFHGTQETESHWSDAAGALPVLEGFHGRVTFASGEVARCVGVEAIEAGAADEPFAGLLILVLPDGSTGWQRFRARVAARDADGTLSGGGTWAWIEGTGAFRGLGGGGTLDWRYRAPLWRATFRGGPEEG